MFFLFMLEVNIYSTLPCENSPGCTQMICELCVYELQYFIYIILFCDVKEAF